MEINGGMAVALALEALGIERVFAIPSAHNLPMLNAIHHRGRIAVTGCRHEQGVVHAADGYSRATGGLAVAIVSTGPGTANTMGGLYEAHYASSPVLLITTQVPTDQLGRGRGYTHEAERQHEMLATACREVVTVTHAHQIAETIVRLGRSALTGRPRPVALEVPLDLQEVRIDIDEQQLREAGGIETPRLTPDPQDIRAAAELLAAAERPIVLAGGGVLRSGAEAALVELAEKMNAPVLTTPEGRSALSDDDPHSLGAVTTIRAMSDYISQCDLMLAVGTRFQQFSTANWSLQLPDNLIHIDADPTVIGRNYPATHPVIADAHEALRALAAALPDLAADLESSRSNHLQTGRKTADEALAVIAEHTGPDHSAICAAINRHRPQRGVVVRDATVPAYVWGETLLSVQEPRTSIRSTAAGIGPGLPLAIGAALGTDEHTVLMQGDGGSMLSIGELATAVQYQARVIICMFNDNGYQMLRNIGRMVGEPSNGVELTTPRFTALAEAFGANSVFVDTPESFESAFVDALAYSGPTLIEIDMKSLSPLTFPIVG